ncbi:MAG: nucleotidyltransferase domain-containing protein [Candidatus Omnitrophica bacterium]|nr:nucleotidyltransferase domain-containing protein [Candidatus Omnitrophota bacterium]
MTNALFITHSKTRREILGFLFANPRKEFYLRDLARKLGFPAGNVRRELLKLVEEGVVTARREANLRYFKLNEGHPLFQELKSIIEKTVGIFGRLKDMFAELGGIEVAVIYGSFAKGEERGESDIDLLVVGSLKKSVEALLERKLANVEKSFQREINCTVFEPGDFARKVKDPANYLSEVIKQKRIFLIGDEKRFRRIIKTMA